MIDELDKIENITSIIDRKLFFIGLLTRETEKKGFRPIVVGGSAVEFYSEQIYTSLDIDLIGNRKVIGEILKSKFGFETSGRHWINEQMGLFVEVPGSNLAGDENKLTRIDLKILSISIPLSVSVIGIEDLILDRMRACIYWKSETDCEQARFLLKAYKNRIDLEYLKETAKREEDRKVIELLIDLLKKDK